MLAVQEPGNEGNISTTCCGIDIHDMYLSSNVTQWNVANCMVFSIPPSPVSSFKSSCIKGELKQTATEVQLHCVMSMCSIKMHIIETYIVVAEHNSFWVTSGSRLCISRQVERREKSGGERGVKGESEGRGKRKRRGKGGGRRKIDERE